MLLVVRKGVNEVFLGKEIIAVRPGQRSAQFSASSGHAVFVSI